MQKLETADAAGLDSLRNGLSEIVLLENDLPQIYQVLQTAKPDDNEGENAIRFLLLRRVAGIQNGETTDFISRLYPSLDGFPALQAAALSVLVQGKTDESLREMMRILRQYMPDLGGYQGLVLGQLFETPEKISLVSEDLFFLATEPPYELQAVELIAVGLSSGQIKASDIRSGLKMLTDKFAQIQASGATQRKAAPAASQRQLQMAILQCFSYFPDDSVASEFLNQTISSKKEEGEVRLSAALAALRAGLEVDASVWEEMAADFRTRNQVYTGLAQAGHSSLFPARYNHQESFAEGDLAAWLMSRDHLPESFRPMGTVVIESGPEQGNIYVFEFKEKGQWLVGISGPQPMDTGDFVEMGFLTTSKFEKAGKRKPEEIADDLIE
ncbi:MAG: hypothetical protein R3C61_20070 [Bacteroidia bacterium]